MTRRWIGGVFFIGLVIAGCGDQVDRAENCTELDTAWREATNEEADQPAEVVLAIHRRVAEQAHQMRGDALARGAEAEVELCDEIQSAADIQIRIWERRVTE